MKNFEKVWERYKDECVPKTASDVQIRETKRAFYAGAISFFSMLLRGVEHQPHEKPTEKELNLVESIGQELYEFFDSGIVPGEK